MTRPKPAGPTGRFIHYEPERIDYAVSDGELEKLRKGEHPIWKDVFLVTFALAVPTLVNAIVEIANQQEFKPTLAIFLNSLIGISSLMFSAISGLVWRQQRKDFTSVIDGIRKKPRFEIPPGIFDARALQAKPPDQPGA